MSGPIIEPSRLSFWFQIVATALMTLGVYTLNGLQDEVAAMRQELINHQLNHPTENLTARVVRLEADLSNHIHSQ